MQIEKNKVVSIDYVLKDAEGQLIDSTENEGPFEYLHGYAQILPELENLLDGKVEGDSFEATFTPDQAYGERSDDKIQTVPRSEFAHIPQIEVGMPLTINLDDGQIMYVTVTDVNDETVTLDANHPLAGVTLSFNVVVVGMRDATEKEVQQGHPEYPEHEHGHSCGCSSDEDEKKGGCCGGGGNGGGCGCS